MNNQFPEIAKVAKAIDKMAVSRGWSNKIKHDINLAVEEVVSNIIFYAYTDDLQHEILILIEPKLNTVCITINDDGREFNWLNKQPEVNINAPVEEREVGGLGIHLLKKIMDKITYSRTNNTNIVTMEKKLS
jgi:anti-sigma regulatory factor (Ser/Thr protein kinase)